MPSLVTYIIPGIVLLIIMWGFLKNIDCFSSFLIGAKEGMSTIKSILPSLIGLMVAVGVFRASGALDMVIGIMKPATDFLGLDSQVIPLVLLRPVSGSASLAVLNDIIQNCGPDSFAGRTASVMMGSSETILYTMAIYLSAVAVKKAPHVLAAALTGHFVSVIVASFVCKIFV